MSAIAGALCSAVGIVLYLNTLNCGFCYDDKVAVLQNQDLLPTSPWANLLWNDFWGNPMQLNTSHKSYRPLCVASFRLNYMLHGLQPMGYHLVNVLLHAMVCYLYVQLCALVFTQVWPALLAGLLFAVHPIHTEAVAGVVGRADLLCAVFYLLSLILYHYHVTNQPDYVPNRASSMESRKAATNKAIQLSFPLSVMCVVSATLSKELGITAIGVCLAYDLIILQKGSPFLQLSMQKPRSLAMKPLSMLTKPQSSIKRSFRNRSLLLVACATVLIALRITIMKHTPSFSKQDNEALALKSPYRQLHWAYLVSVNAWLLLHPNQLLHDYRMSTIPLLASLWDVRHIATILTFVTLAALSTVALYKRAVSSNISLCNGSAFDISISNGSHCNGSSHRRSDGPGSIHPNRHTRAPNGSTVAVLGNDAHTNMRPHPSALRPHPSALRPHPSSVLLVGLFLLVIPFIPASNLFFPVGFVVAERILYLPSMGLCMMVGYSAYKMATCNHKVVSLCAKAAVVLLISMQSAKTLVRNNDWHSMVTLYSSVVRHQPRNAHMMVNIAKEFREGGDYARAELVYRHAMSVAPHLSTAFVNCGSMLKGLNRLEDAEEVLRAAIPLLKNDSSKSDVLTSIYNSLCNMISRNTSRLHTATQYCEMAVNLSAESATVHNTLGVVLMHRGENKEAIEAFKKAAALNRTNTMPEYNMALAYTNIGEHNLAIQSLQRVLAADSGHIAAKMQLQELQRRTS